MLRVLQDPLGLAALHYLAVAEHEDLVGDDPGAEQVVSDVKQAEAALAAQVGEQGEHPGTERDVQHGDGLVGDHQLRLAGERAGDQDPLALAAGQLVRELFHELARRGEADGLEQFADPLPGLRAGHAQEVLAGPRQRVLDGVHRVERAVRVLKDHLHPGVQPAQPAGPQPPDVRVAERDRA